MKKQLNVLLTTLVLLLSTTIQAANNQEFRSAWVITWEYLNASLSTDQAQAKIRKIMANMKAANMNAVIWQVRQSGTAYYQSSYEPWGSYAGHDGKTHESPGFDPLAYAVQEAHKRGMELHAWFNTFQTSSDYPGTPAILHPEWISTLGNGTPMPRHESLSPGLEEVRKYTLNVAMEIVNNYDIDGLHLDYIRWNEYDTGNINSLQKRNLHPDEESGVDGMFTPEQMNTLSKTASGDRYIYDAKHLAHGGIPTGYTNWDDWRRGSVTAMVRALHDSIQQVKPWVRLSPAALGKYNWSGWNGYDIVFQDAALWFNEGSIDQLMGMHYHWTTADGFYGMLKGDCPNCWQSYIQPGIAAGRLFSVGPGSYRFGSNWNNHPSVVNKIRTIPWVDGFQFFSYASWNDHAYWDDAARLFFISLNKIRPIKQYDSTAPQKPLILFNKESDLSYTVKTLPMGGSAHGYWYAIYRSENASSDVTKDKIIKTAFGNDTLRFTDPLTGNQDFNGKYYYYATVFDRYWNESDPSDIMQSDSIPSYPPYVSATTPAAGDSLSINQNIVITFSKHLTSTGPDSIFHFVPNIVFKSIVWSGNNQTVTFTPQDLLPNNTEYQLTIDPVLMDSNGRLLDGNGDHVAGDPFVMSFRTLAHDDMPPLVENTYPQNSQSNVDVRAALTVTFNEKMDPATLTPSNISLYSGSSQKLINFDVKDVNHRTVVSILTADPMDPSSLFSLYLTKNLADSSGNLIGKDQQVKFTTSPKHYYDDISIDDFTAPGDWQQPNYSGSTVGVNPAKSSFGFTPSTYLPTSTPKKGAYLSYTWENGLSNYLLREYLKGGVPRTIEYDTSYTIQVYVFGDGSNNKFRFAMDESHDGGWPDHEVSKWTTIDWYGWRLVEWQLSDSNSVGSWISPDEKLNGDKYRVDSFQLTHDSTGAMSGRVYFDNFRVVKKTEDPVSLDRGDQNTPHRFDLFQNYPNPFNPTTVIGYSLPTPDMVSLKIYDVRGRLLRTLFDGFQSAGTYKLTFNAAGLATGIYYYTLRTASGLVKSQKMIVVK